MQINYLPLEFMTTDNFVTLRTGENILFSSARSQHHVQKQTQVQYEQKEADYVDRFICANVANHSGSDGLGSLSAAE